LFSPGMSFEIMLILKRDARSSLIVSNSKFLACGVIRTLYPRR
jgi:hypothetical protein